MKKKSEKKSDASSELLEGLVLKTTGASCWVKTTEGELIECVVRGKFRLEEEIQTNPVAVGDRVYIKKAVISTVEEVLPRENRLYRKSGTHKRKLHTLCANIDQIWIVFTIDFPTTSFGFINRLLVMAEMEDIPATILINKTDLLTTEAQKKKWAEVKNIYQLAGYEVIEVVATDPIYLPALTAGLKDKTTFIAGHSGVGKSTLINRIEPTLALKIGELSNFSLKGQHTTTFTEMYPLSFGGYLIDAPGIKEMGIPPRVLENVAWGFPEIRKYLSECRFSDCKHIDEPACAVKEALEAGHIPVSRYKSYLSILSDIEEEEELYS